MKKGLRIGIALGLVVVALGIGVAVTRAVTYRAEFDCSPLSSNGQTNETNCKIVGDRVWISKIAPHLISRDQCSFTAYISDDTWTLTPCDIVFPEGVILDICISGASYADFTGHDCPPGGKPYTGIYPLSSDEQVPYLSLPNAAGATACGVFDVNGWGAKYVGLADFPGCTAPVTVMCLNGDGEWTADTVSDVVMHGDWEVDFTSSQHGVCGLFAQ